MEVKELTILWSIVRSPGCSIYHVFIYTYSTSKVNIIAFICKKYFIEIKTSSWYNGILDIKCTPLISQSLMQESYFDKDHTLICKQQTHLYMYWTWELFMKKQSKFIFTTLLCMSIT